MLDLSVFFRLLPSFDLTLTDRTASVNVGSVDSTNETPAFTTKRGLKSRHAQMIALGGTIGTGLFVGSGQALNRGGPLFLLLAYVFISVLVYGVATALGEMSAYLPLPGTTVGTLGDRFVSQSLGFTLGWVYVYIYALTAPAEINATVLVLGYWNPPSSPAVWITIVGVVVFLCNFLPVTVYGEAEFWFASTKVIGIVGLLILTVVLFFGGGPSHEPLWFSNWNDGGATKPYILNGDIGRLIAIISITTFSVYAFAFAPELLVTTSGEMESPRRNILGALAIGIIVPSTDPNLLNGTTNAASSPWAIGINRAGIPILAHVVNAIIVLSAWSAANGYFYLASRALYSMAVAGNAPRIFKHCTRRGVPIYASIAVALFSALAYINVSAGGVQVFNWLLNIINTGAFQSWTCCCIIYVRFRKAADFQGVTDLPYRSRFQPYGALVAGILFFVLMLLNGLTVFLAVQWDVSDFFTAYIGIPVFLIVFFEHKITVGRNDPWAYPPGEIDLTTGLEEIIAVEKPAPPQGKWYEKWKKILD
ncbi:putative proline-specific permease [Astrocystis sublimbata]|nr:putative proline-specific permease [Astrocystis sublimbata]